MEQVFVSFLRAFKSDVKYIDNGEVEICVGLKIIPLGVHMRTIPTSSQFFHQRSSQILPHLDAFLNRMKTRSGRVCIPYKLL